jgi:hypothetical protein
MIHTKSFSRPSYRAAGRVALPACAVAVSFLFLGSMLIADAASGAETVRIGRSKAVLLRPAAPVGSVILMPGGNGRIEAGPHGHIGKLKNNQLVRTRGRYEAKGLAVLVVDADVNLGEAVDFMGRIKRPVTVIGTSRGTQGAARGIAAGARPDALVLTSGFLSDASGSTDNVINILGSPQRLPKTLVIHHRHDGCKFTRPVGVAPFVKWAAGKARVVWLDGGTTHGDPCRSRSHHGFEGLDDRVVALAAAFR